MYHSNTAQIKNKLPMDLKKHWQLFTPYPRTEQDYQI